MEFWQKYGLVVYEVWTAVENTVEETVWALTLKNELTVEVE